MCDVENKNCDCCDMQDANPLEVDYDDEPIKVSCTIVEGSADDALMHVKPEVVDHELEDT